MQPLSGPGVPVGDRSSVNPQTGVTRHGSVAGEQPLFACAAHDVRTPDRAYLIAQ